MDEAYAEALELAEEHKQKKNYQGYVSHSINLATSPVRNFSIKGEQRSKSFVQPVRPTLTSKPFMVAAKTDQKSSSDDSYQDEDMNEFSEAKTAGVPILG